MYRTHTSNDLSDSLLNKTITLCGWIQKIRDKGFIIWIDLRDAYGITQIVFDKSRTNPKLIQKIKSLNREYVIQITGSLIEREAKNLKLKTGNYEVLASTLKILNSAKLPPFIIEDETDGNEEIRMKYRYLDIRRTPIKNNLIHRHTIAREIRNYLSDSGFIEIETPFLIKSTPEGARDFIVPSRINEKQFYALPQSPQTFKQLLMVGGIDKYFQIVKCFRDEDLRADRQPEFTQIDCEMAFVNQTIIKNTFEALIIHILKIVRKVQIDHIPTLTYQEAINKYGSDKPDIRFDMEIKNITSLAVGKRFKIFDSQKFVGAISVTGKADYSRKEIDKLIDWVKQPQVGAHGLIWVKYLEDGSTKSSVDNFFSKENLQEWLTFCNSKPGDILFVMTGELNTTLRKLGAFRIQLATNLGLRDPMKFSLLWIVDFPLLEWDKEANRYYAMHHPFTSPKHEDIHLLENHPEKVRANAYDMILNGNEIGGGSIRIHQKDLQENIFKILGFSKKEIEKQFGFLINAFQYGAPPHGGIAFGFDRLVALLAGEEIIKNFIAFPKNNAGRDTMIEAPDYIKLEQLNELNISLK